MALCRALNRVNQLTIVANYNVALWVHSTEIFYVSSVVESSVRPLEIQVNIVLQLIRVPTGPEKP